MRRRDLIILLGAAALSDAPIGRAQEPGRVYRLGVMVRGPRENVSLAAFFDELRGSGFVEGQNLRVEGRFSIRDEDAPEVAAALATAGVDAILTGSDHRTRIVQKATRTIPIVAVADDLVLSGLVSSLSRPGGNTTGISILATELDGKRQELLIELVPTARRMAALADDTAPEQLRALEEAARARGVELSIHPASKPEEIVPALDAAKASGALALNVLASGLFNLNQQLIIDRTVMFQLPAIYQWPEIAEAGGLAAYGPRYAEVYRQLARQLVKIFRGAKPGDIPVEQPDKFELVINLQTAKAIALQVPPALLGRADGVIE
jgi:putative tryptophan/tyrosine transport system substrate-binding protein